MKVEQKAWLQFENILFCIFIMLRGTSSTFVQIINAIGKNISDCLTSIVINPNYFGCKNMQTITIMHKILLQWIKKLH